MTMTNRHRAVITDSLMNSIMTGLGLRILFMGPRDKLTGVIRINSQLLILKLYNVQYLKLTPG